MPYRWRKLTNDEKADLLRWRRAHQRPWHTPPHLDMDYPFWHVSAACYQHRPVIGASLPRMKSFQDTLLTTLGRHSTRIVAWCLLPNHYHALVEARRIGDILKAIGRMHGRTSHAWNGEDRQRGRKVWFNCAERAIRGERHFWATVNYIHHNPVRHAYVKRWQEWPFSSALQFMESVGHDAAENIWRLYPILDYGKGWDDPGL